MFALCPIFLADVPISTLQQMAAHLYWATAPVLARSCFFEFSFYLGQSIHALHGLQWADGIKKGLARGQAKRTQIHHA